MASSVSVEAGRIRHPSTVWMRARRRARGAVERFGADAAVSVTGVAGPGGGTEAKPVGTVWLGVARGSVAEAHALMLPGNRRDIRMRAAQAAIFRLLRRLQAV